MSSSEHRQRPFEPWEQRMVDVFQGVAATRPAVVLDVGFGGPGGNAVGVDLIPPNPNCASLSAMFSAPNEIDLFLADAIPIELWYKKNEAEELLHDLRLWIEAVVEGRLEATIWRRHGQVVRAKAKILVGDQWRHASYRSLPGLVVLGQTDKQVHDFEPYQ